MALEEIIKKKCTVDRHCCGGQEGPQSVGGKVQLIMDVCSM